MPEGRLVYREKDGFARDGVLIFAVDSVKAGCSVLSIYVAFSPEAAIDSRDSNGSFSGAFSRGSYTTFCGITRCAS